LQWKPKAFSGGNEGVAKKPKQGAAARTFLSRMKPPSREELLGTAKPVPPDKDTAPKFASGKTNRSGKVPAGDVRLTANISRELHILLKIESAKRQKSIGEIIEDWIREKVETDHV
jgi:hypothetical protein